MGKFTLKIDKMKIKDEIALIIHSPVTTREKNDAQSETNKKRELCVHKLKHNMNNTLHVNLVSRDVNWVNEHCGKT